MYPMFTILKDVIHPETREPILHSGWALSEERLNLLADEFGFDRVPELLSMGVIVDTKPLRHS